MQTKTFLQADTRKSTAILKKYLREKYGINASIKSKFYSGGSSLNISYIGGISQHVIEREVNRLQYGRFDGMIDLYEYNNSAENGLIIDGNLNPVYTEQCLFPVTLPIYVLIISYVFPTVRYFS